MNIHILLENSVYNVGKAARDWVINMVSEIIVVPQFWSCDTTFFSLATYWNSC
jgi:hypothetical protein